MGGAFYGYPWSDHRRARTTTRRNLVFGTCGAVGHVCHSGEAMAVLLGPSRNGAQRISHVPSQLDSRSGSNDHRYNLRN